MGADAYAASEVLDRRRRRALVEKRGALGDGRPE
jgi:hypothetical protein